MTWFMTALKWFLPFKKQGNLMLSEAKTLRFASHPAMIWTSTIFKAKNISRWVVPRRPCPDSLWDALSHAGAKSNLGCALAQAQRGTSSFHAAAATSEQRLV